MEDDVRFVSKPEELIKKQILGLVTYMDQDDNIVKIIEVFGKVKEVENSQVIVNGKVWSQEEGDDEMEIKENSDFSFPFDPENYWYAEEGEYNAILSGQKVSNPDVLTQWRIYPPHEV